MQSRAQAFWGGVRRGGKFGAIAGIVIWFVVLLGCLAMIVLIPDLRNDAIADLKKQSVLSAIGGFIAPIGLMAVYGAVPGAIIMGIASLLRARREQQSNPE